MHSKSCIGKALLQVIDVHSVKRCEGFLHDVVLLDGASGHGGMTWAGGHTCQVLVCLAHIEQSNQLVFGDAEIDGELVATTPRVS